MRLGVKNKEELGEIKVELALSFFKRLKGYMFDKEPRSQYLLISPCNSIHTFFMFFAIDVAFLDDQGKIIKLIRGMEKNQWIAPVKNAKGVLESPKGKMAELEEGDTLYPLGKEDQSLFA